MATDVAPADRWEAFGERTDNWRAGIREYFRDCRAQPMSVRIIVRRTEQPRDFRRPRLPPDENHRVQHQSEQIGRNSELIMMQIGWSRRADESTYGDYTDDSVVRETTEQTRAPTATTQTTAWCARRPLHGASLVTFLDVCVRHVFRKNPTTTTNNNSRRKNAR